MTTNRLGTTRVTNVPTPGRWTAVPIVVGIVAFAFVLVLGWLDVLAGPLALLLAGVVWLGIPTSSRMSRRLAVNGAVALGVIPALWWFPWPAAVPVSHTALILGAGVGFIAYRAVVGGVARRALLPTVQVADLIPFAAVLVASWYFRPFFSLAPGPGTVAMLRGAFGNDNVAHFDMFGMIRRNLASGPSWPTPEDGSLFAYVPYPQHFHAFAAFASEIWSGAPVGAVDAEISLYGIATALTIGFAFVTLVAAVASMRTLHGRWVLSGVVATGVFAFLLLGFGSSALSYGFPPYLFATIATLVGIVIAMERGVAKAVDVFAVGASVVAVAHSWSLLTPVVGVAAVLIATRLPWAAYRLRPTASIPVLAAVVGSVAGLGFAVYLVVAATFTVGPPDAVLATSGMIPVTSVPFTFALGFVLLGFAVLILSRIGSLHPWNGESNPFVLFGAVAIVAAVQAGVLIAVQLVRAGGLDYFQYKFLNAILMIFAVLLVLIAVLAVARESTPKMVRARIGAAAGGATIAIALVLASASSPAPGVYLAFAGLQFRHDLYSHAQSEGESDARLVAAANLMATWPCTRPIYLAPFPDDARMEESNQWAMSLSGTWTERAAPINTYLFSRFSDDPRVEVDSIARGLLAEDDDSCIVVAPEVRDALGAGVVESFDSRIFSW